LTHKYKLADVLGINFAGNRQGPVPGLPDDLEPPVIARLDAVINRRRGAAVINFSAARLALARLL
jgi:hypothetical protein